MVMSIRYGKLILFLAIFIVSIVNGKGKSSDYQRLEDQPSENQLSENKPSEYYFAQQFNATCLMVPVMNLELLNNAKLVNYDFSKLPSYQRAQWMGILNPFEVAWFKPFEEINYWNQPTNPDLITLKNYLDDCVAHGPAIPHFYNKDGTFPFSGFLKGPIVAIASLPFALVDVNAMFNLQLKILFGFFDIGPKIAELTGSNVYLNLPVFQTPKDIKNNILRVFNNNSMEYEPKSITDYIEADKTIELVPGEPQNLLKLPDNPNQLFYMDNYSKHPIFKTYTRGGIYLWLGTGYQTEAGAYGPYMQGVYKMMLSVLGYGHDNLPLVVDGRPTISIDKYGERDAIIALQNICNADDKNPWNKKHFHKEDFLPIAVAEILKGNPRLANQVKQTVDFMFENWKQYANLTRGDYYNKNGEQMTLETVAKFIPGEHQILAYSALQNARYLWYGSHSTKAFYNLSLPYIPLVWEFKTIKNAAYKKITIKNGIAKKASFMDTWKLLRTAILGQYGERNWISFDGHGWTISFDPKIIQKERALSKKMNDAPLNKDLGFAGIESIMTDDSLFYKVQHFPFTSKSKSIE